MKRRLSALHLFGCSQRTHAKFFHAQESIIIRIERDQRVVLCRHMQCLHREVFQSEQELGTIGQQELHIGAGKVNGDFGILYFGMRIFRGTELVRELKSGVPQKRQQEPVQLGPQRIDSIFHAVYFLASFFTGALDATGVIGAAGGMKRLMSSCWAMPTTFPVNQYSTSPEEAE